MPVLNELNEHIYQRLHQILLHQPTRREKKLNIMMQDPVQTPVVLEPKIWNKNEMYPGYLFDGGLTTELPTKLYQWWKKYFGFDGSPLQDVTVKLVANTNRTLETFFIHKKPSKQLLTKKPTI